MSDVDLSWQTAAACRADDAALSFIDPRLIQQLVERGWSVEDAEQILRVRKRAKVFLPPRLPRKHQTQRDKETAARKTKRASYAPQHLSDEAQRNLNGLVERQRDRYRRARSICMTCPVRAECLAFAMDPANEITDGMWGGTTEEERHSLAKARDRLVDAERAAEAMGVSMTA